jgi:3-deoxy-manno-octulosonate cytidylyltransferase (CMP-KDO synthetase)
MKIVAVIPARYQSSRFPGKPLTDILGKSLVQRVWLKTTGALNNEDVYIATDDQRIKEHCEGFGAKVVMTSDSCLTGTDRVAELAEKVEADIYLNVQGDEPLIDPSDILKVIKATEKSKSEIFCALTEIKDEDDFRSSSVPKVVASETLNLLYMSRGAIPTNKKLGFEKSWKQVCIYAFSKKSLKKFSSRTSKAKLENIEDIEILRFLEMDMPVQMVEVSSSSIAVDFPEDKDKVIKYLRDNSEE